MAKKSDSKLSRGLTPKGIVNIPSGEITVGGHLKYQVDSDGTIRVEDVENLEFSISKERGLDKRIRTKGVKIGKEKKGTDKR